MKILYFITLYFFTILNCLSEMTHGPNEAIESVKVYKLRKGEDVLLYYYRKDGNYKDFKSIYKEEIHPNDRISGYHISINWTDVWTKEHGDFTVGYHGGFYENLNTKIRLKKETTVAEFFVWIQSQLMLQRMEKVSKKTNPMNHSSKKKDKEGQDTKESN